MAAFLQQEFGVDAELIPGSGGVFDVRVDGELIYSKDDMGRFPADDEIAKGIRELEGE